MLFSIGHFSRFHLIIKSFSQMLAVFGDLDGFFIIDEPSDEFVIEHIELQEAIVDDFVFYLQVEETKRL